MDNIAWSEELLPNSEQVIDDWVEPPEFAPAVPAGKYTGYVDIISAKDQKMVENIGQRWFATFDIRIVGGEQDDRTVRFVSINNIERNRKTTGTVSSQGMDLLRAAGITTPLRTNKDYMEGLERLRDAGPAMKFGFQCDWRAFCMSCYNAKLMQLTGAETPEAAKAIVRPGQKASAAEFATKATTYSKFPDAPNGKGKMDQFICPNCSEPVRAKVEVKRFMRPTF